MSCKEILARSILQKVRYDGSKWFGMDFSMNLYRGCSHGCIYCGILFTPTLPFITDTEENIRALVISAAKHGAKFMYHREGVTLRDRQRDYYYEKIAAIDPQLPERYQKAFGERYMCNSPQAKSMSELFRSLCKEHGLAYRMHDIIKAYKREPDPTPVQPKLF